MLKSVYVNRHICNQTRYLSAMEYAWLNTQNALILDWERHPNFREIFRIPNGNLPGRGLTANRQQWPT